MYTLLSNCSVCTHAPRWDWAVYPLQTRSVVQQMRTVAWQLPYPEPGRSPWCFFLKSGGCRVWSSCCWISGPFWKFLYVIVSKHASAVRIPCSPIIQTMSDNVGVQQYCCLEHSSKNMSRVAVSTGKRAKHIPACLVSAHVLHIHVQNNCIYTYICEYMHTHLYMCLRFMNLSYKHAMRGK